MLTTLSGLLLLVGTALSLDNGVGRVPPMGWSSWNSFVDLALTDDVIRSMADQLVSLGLRDLGYKYVNVDCGWSIPNRTMTGTMQPNATRFPKGMKAVGDYIHSRGLLYGLYTARGEHECCGGVGYNGSQYAIQDAKTFVEWGVDYLKVDSCGYYPKNQPQWDQFTAMRDALNQTGRPIYLSICETWTGYNGSESCHKPGGIVYSPLEWLNDPKKDVSSLGNGILIEYANNGNQFDIVTCIIEAQQRLTFSNLSGPGHWNDNDMLTVGCTDHHVNLPWTPCKEPPGLTVAESRAQFSTWSILASPLILGNDLRFITPETFSIISNPEVIAVNQDPIGFRGLLIAGGVQEGYQVYGKILSRLARRAVLVLNTSPRQLKVTVRWRDLWLGGGPWVVASSVRDLWLHTVVATNQTDGYTAVVESHDVIMLEVQF